MGTEIPSSPPPHPYQTCMKNKERQKVVHDGLAESQSGLSPKSFPHVGKLFCFPRSLEEKKNIVGWVNGRPACTDTQTLTIFGIPLTVTLVHARIRGGKCLQYLVIESSRDKTTQCGDIRHP